MDRAVTAIYRSYTMACLVREELERLGLGRDRITLLPGARIVPNAEEASSSATTRGNVENALARLHKLLLSKGDTQACQQALQNGGYVVSVSLHEDADLNLAQEVMSRPAEAYDLNELDVICAGAHMAAANQSATITTSRVWAKALSAAESGNICPKQSFPLPDSIQ